MDDDELTAEFERRECMRRDLKALRDRSRVVQFNSLRLMAKVIMAALNRNPNAALSVALDIRDGRVAGWEIRE
jgi:hypothetical protein